jgi:predicted nucleic acid-binding protein
MTAVAAMPAPTVIVVTDANVLINFCHIERLPLLGQLAPWRFKVPEEVIDEVADAGQRAVVDAAVDAGHLEAFVLSDVAALSLFADLRAVMGRGEAACLASAATAHHLIASDEKKRFRRRAIELLGEASILRTEDLLIRAIQLGHLTVAQADACKVILAEHRYAMPFASFAERL